MSLDEYLESCRSRVFDWADWNCAHFIAGWVRHRMGIDILGAYTVRTDTPLAAYRLASSFGSLDAAVTAALGRPAAAPLSARVGDIVFFGGSGVAGMLGICNGVSAVCLAENGGFLPEPMKNAFCVWDVT